MEDLRVKIQANFYQTIEDRNKATTSHAFDLHSGMLVAYNEVLKELNSRIEKQNESRTRTTVCG